MPMGMVECGPSRISVQGAFNMTDVYPIGTAGTPWGDAEKAQWLARQEKAPQLCR